MLVPSGLTSVDGRSFALGMIYAFAEVVASGCKPMAYSPPFEPGEVEDALDAARAMAEEYGVVVHHDVGFTPTRLFNPAFTEGKQVIVVAADPAVLNDYLALQARQQQGPNGADPDLFEEEVARELGRLLGYSPEAVDDLLVHPRF